MSLKYESASEPLHISGSEPLQISGAWVTGQRVGHEVGDEAVDLGALYMDKQVMHT